MNFRFFTDLTIFSQKKVGKDIRGIRQAKGLSQKGLAKKLGVSQQLVSRVEKGKENISLRTLTSISRALNRKIEINLTKSTK